MKPIIITLIQDGDTWLAVSQTPDRVGVGPTVEEALANVAFCINGWMQAQAKLNNTETVRA